MSQALRWVAVCAGAALWPSQLFAAQPAEPAKAAIAVPEARDFPASSDLVHTLAWLNARAKSLYEDAMRDQLRKNPPAKDSLCFVHGPIEYPYSMLSPAQWRIVIHKTLGALGESEGENCLAAFETLSVLARVDQFAPRAEPFSMLTDADGRSLLPLLAACADSQSQPVRLLALQYLADSFLQVCTVSDRVAVLLRHADDDAEVVRHRCIQTLGFILDREPYDGPTLTNEQFTRIIRVLRDGAASADTQVCRVSVNSMGRLGEASRPLVTELVLHLVSDSTPRRSGAHGALAAMGPRAAQCVPDLVTLIGSKNPGMRQRAIRLLGNMGDAAGVALPQLIAVLDEPQTGTDTEVQQTVASTLTRLAPFAQPVLPKLREIASRDAGALGHAATSAIEAIERGEVPKHLRRPWNEQ